MTFNRRHCLIGLAAATTATRFASRLPAADEQPTRRVRPLAIFAKHLQLLSWDELGEFCRSIDVDGIEATLRKGGQIQPQEVADRLPKLVDQLAKYDQRVLIGTTDIKDARVDVNIQVLDAMAKAGVGHYRMSYYKYDVTQPILPQLAAFTAQAEELAAINKSLGLIGLYQNHAGSAYFGAPLWDLHQMLAQVDSQSLRMAYDVRHAAVEAVTGWPISLALLRPYIGAVYLKDHRVENGKIANVPFGTGDVPEELLNAVRKDWPEGPVSLHMEYHSHTDPAAVETSRTAYREDRQRVRQLMGL